MLRTDVIWSQSALDIMCRPYLVGSALAKLSKKSSEDWISHLDCKALGDKPVSLEILNGGHYYFVAKAYTAITGKPCAVASLRAKRHCEGTQWTVDIWEEKLEPLVDATSVLIGDTIATGTTLAGVLQHIIDFMEKSGNFVDIHVFSIAGSYECEPELQETAERLSQHGKTMTLTYCNCKLALADNGTDLKFDNARDMLPEAQAGLREALPEGFASRMKCAVWDWGDRFTRPLDHLDEVTEYFHSIGGVPRWLQDGLNISHAQTLDEMKDEGRRRRDSAW